MTGQLWIQMPSSWISVFEASESSPDLLDQEILGWCPAASALPYREKRYHLTLIGGTASDVVIIKIIYGVNALYYRPVLIPSLLIG